MTRNRSQFRIALAAAAITLTATGIARQVGAFNPQPDPPGRYALIGLLRGQTARVNVYNARNLEALADGSVRTVPPDPCKVTVRFFYELPGRTTRTTDGSADPETQGKLLPAVQRTFFLRSGETGHLDVDSGALLPAVQPADGSGQVNRVQLTATVQVTPLFNSAGRAFPPGPCKSTLEVMDSETGETRFFSPGGLGAHNPPSN